MFAKTFGGALVGIDARLISVEINIVSGTKIYISGLPDIAIRESINRVESTIKHLGFQMPRHKTLINLAPADLRKEGSAFDMAIAMGLLAASLQIDGTLLSESMIMGELGLNGLLRPIKGVLPLAIEARKHGLKRFILPKENAREAAIVKELDVFGVENMREAVDFIQGELELTPVVQSTREIFEAEMDEYPFDFDEVQGQENIKRAMEIAAAGGHNVMMLCTFIYLFGT